MISSVMNYKLLLCIIVDDYTYDRSAQVYETLIGIIILTLQKYCEITYETSLMPVLKSESLL